MKNNLKHITTNDGSHTFHSEEYDEAYHSRSGALNEAFKKFATPCRIARLAKSGRVRILDVGFGLGYNALAALHTARKANRDCIVEIVSFEKEVISRAQLDAVPIPDDCAGDYDIIKNVAEALRYSAGGITIEILPGDARQSIQSLRTQFDAVFHDPFSVRKNPELWTVQFFARLFDRMTDSAIFATYSAATPVRSGLLEAGFAIGAGPGDVMKKGGTLATKRGDITPLSEKDTRRIENSPERMPFYDPARNFSRDEIIDYRKRLIS